MKKKSNRQRKITPVADQTHKPVAPKPDPSSFALPIVEDSHPVPATPSSEEEPGTKLARLEEELAARRQDLARCSPDDDAIECARAQHLLAVTLLELGELTANEGLVEEAGVAVREALTVYSEEGVPADWESAKKEAEILLECVDRWLQLRGALKHEHLVVATAVYEGEQGRLPRTARRVGYVEWAWSPANSRWDSLHLSTEISRKRWILWVCWEGEGCGAEPLDFRIATCPKKGMSAKEAAWTLVTAFYRNELRFNSLERFQIVDGGELLSKRALWTIADEIWGPKPEAR